MSQKLTLKEKFHRAVFFGKEETFKQILQEKSSDLKEIIDSKDASGSTALHHAAFQGHTEIARQLLENNCDPEVSNVEGCTALMHAAFEGHEEIVFMILEKKVDVNYL